MSHPDGHDSGPARDGPAADYSSGDDEHMQQLGRRGGNR
jgi:hypothetical protein